MHGRDFRERRILLPESILRDLKGLAKAQSARELGVKQGIETKNEKEYYP
jgi:hypothetical protein